MCKRRAGRREEAAQRAQRCSSIAMRDGETKAAQQARQAQTSLHHDSTRSPGRGESRQLSSQHTSACGHPYSWPRSRSSRGEATGILGVLYERNTSDPICMKYKKSDAQAQDMSSVSPLAPSAPPLLSPPAVCVCMCMCVWESACLCACVRACVRDRFSWNRAIRKRQFRLPGFDLAIMLHKQGVILHLAPWRIPLTHSRGRPPGRKRSSSSLPMRTIIVSPSCLPYLAPPAASTVSSCACYSGMLIGRAGSSSGLRDS